MIKQFNKNMSIDEILKNVANIFEIDYDKYNQHELLNPNKYIPFKNRYNTKLSRD